MLQLYSQNEFKRKSTISKILEIDLIPVSFEKDKTKSNIIKFLGADETRYSLSEKAPISPCLMSFQIDHSPFPRYWIKKRSLESIKSFERERDTFFKIRNDLLKDNKYAGKYVAILNGKVVGSDENKSSLAKRVYEKHGYVPIYMEKLSKKKRVRELPSPERWV